MGLVPRVAAGSSLCSTVMGGLVTVSYWSLLRLKWTAGDQCRQYLMCVVGLYHYDVMGIVKSGGSEH